MSFKKLKQKWANNKKSNKELPNPVVEQKVDPVVEQKVDPVVDLAEQKIELVVKPSVE